MIKFLNEKQDFSDRVQNILYFQPFSTWKICKGNCTSNQNWACFVHHLDLKIIKKYFGQKCKHSEQIVWNTQNSFKVSVGQVVLELLIKTIFCMFDQPLALLILEFLI